MNTDTPERVTLIPIERIEVLNSRDRNAKVFEEIVENIQDIGLKKPITVTEREGLDSEPKYLLVCGDIVPWSTFYAFWQPLGFALCQRQVSRHIFGAPNRA